ncbi:LOG family protein [Thiorhodococcus mannitoliphagus]|uniref:AMP nucleosidase n=1 Tax=Thiorhodococcus mannitoliphagus TaxID=329406 RepID=A0A6P1E0X3_9GAMM|nr:LOG family protein [Thiorhodococcus mannitoliphagus]NEX22961.1 LOG family protein [Thiorhodococcus mannitoliphagus]
MTDHRSIPPKPPHPTQREKPLPWEHPKPRDEDADAAKRIATIMEHPAYREPDHDVDFLHRDATRGVRLQLDYLKAEQGLVEHQVHQSIVVFGSTRLREPETAKRELAKASHAVAQAPEDASLARQLRLAERRMELAQYYDVGRELGRLVGMAGGGPKNSSLIVMTGGGPGGMEAANRGAYEVGAQTAGLNITLAHEQYPNPYVTPGLCFRFHYFALRKLHFMKRAAAIVALPGGFGTLDELFGALTLMQTRKVPPMPVVLIGEAYWRNVFDVDYLIEVGSIDPEDAELFWYAESAAEAWAGIKAWHQSNGSWLFESDDTPWTQGEAR